MVYLFGRMMFGFQETEESQKTIEENSVPETFDSFTSINDSKRGNPSLKHKKKHPVRGGKNWNDYSSNTSNILS